MLDIEFNSSSDRQKAEVLVFERKIKKRVIVPTSFVPIFNHYNIGYSIKRQIPVATFETLDLNKKVYISRTAAYGDLLFITPLVSKLVNLGYDVETYILNSYTDLSQVYPSKLKALPIENYSYDEVPQIFSFYEVTHGRTNVYEAIEKLVGAKKGSLARRPILNINWDYLKERSKVYAKHIKAKKSTINILINLHSSAVERHVSFKRVKPILRYLTMYMKSNELDFKYKLFSYDQKPFAKVIQKYPSNVKILRPKRITDVLYTLKAFDAMISVDTFFIHAAEVIGVPTLAIFTNISPESRVKYYKHVNYIIPNFKKLPCITHCFVHGGCNRISETGFALCAENLFYDREQIESFFNKIIKNKNR